MGTNNPNQPGENVDIHQSFRSAWQNLNLQSKERANMIASDYYGNAQTFKETDELMDISARAIDSISRQNANIAFSTLTIPSTLQMLYGANQINKTAVFAPKSSIKSEPAASKPNCLDEANIDTLIVLDRFFPIIAQAIAKTGVKNIVLQSLTDDVKKVEYDDPVGMMRKLKSLDHPITRKIAEISGKDTAYKDIKNIRTSVGFKGKNFITMKEFREEGQRNRSIRDRNYIENQTSMIVYSAGTTQAPKPIELTNEGILGMYNMFNRQFEENNSLQAGDRFLNLIPIEHVTALVTSDIIAWLKGNTQVLMPFYNKETFVHQLRYWNIQNTMAPGNYYTPLAKTNLPDGSLSHNKNHFTGGEGVTYSLAIDLEKGCERLGVQNPKPSVGYGTSESGPSLIHSINRSGLINQPGKPHDGIEIRIVDKQDNRKAVKDGRIGLLEAKTPNRMKRYYLLSEQTENVFTDDGYYKTYDFGKQNKDGTYHVVGRAKDEVRAYIKYYIGCWDNGVHDVVVSETDPGSVIAHLILRRNKNDNITQREYETSTIQSIHEQLMTEDFEEYSIPDISYKIWDSFPTNMESGKVDGKILSRTTSEIYVLQKDNSFAKSS